MDETVIGETVNLLFIVYSLLVVVHRCSLIYWRCAPEAMSSQVKSSHNVIQTCQTGWDVGLCI